MKNIAIIGAGITGITTAYQLLERGYTVSVFDKNRYAAMETSFANGANYLLATLKYGIVGQQW